MDEQTRLMALAHLKNGKTPRETSELTEISYSSALKLKKELHQAEETETIHQLFNLSEASLNLLLESVKSQLIPVVEAFNAGELVEEETHKLAQGVNGAKMLNQDLQNAASAIANRITQVASTANNADTILSLASALKELQTSFFGEAQNQQGQLPGPSSFEKHLEN